MALQAFPHAQTRFFKADRFIYRFKITGATSNREYGGEEENSFSQEMEDIIRTVLGNLDRLQPFSSTHFLVFPYKKRWKSVSKHCKNNLQYYPFILNLYLEKNMRDHHTSAGGQTADVSLMQSEKKATQHVASASEPQSKRYRRESPLEDSIIKALVQDMKAEGRVIVTGKEGHQHSEVRGGPGYADMQEAKQTDSPRVNEVSGSGTSGEEETPATLIANPGILTQLASFFRFSFFFKKH